MIKNNQINKIDNNFKDRYTLKISLNNKNLFAKFKIFNLYDLNLFVTFFYSEIEKVWLLIVKYGTILIDTEPIDSYKILDLSTNINFQSNLIKFKNMKNQKGLSQKLIEIFMKNSNYLIKENEISNLINSYNLDFVYDCLKNNELFIYDVLKKGFSLNYTKYIEFLESRLNPLINEIKYEMENSIRNGGTIKTFNINNLQVNCDFSEYDDSSSSNKNIGEIKTNLIGTLSWPYNKTSKKGFINKNNKINLINKDLTNDNPENNIKKPFKKIKRNLSVFEEQFEYEEKNIKNFYKKYSENYKDETFSLNYNYNPFYKKTKLDYLPCKRNKFHYNIKDEPIIEIINDNQHKNELIAHFYTDYEYNLEPDENKKRNRSYSQMNYEVKKDTINFSSQKLEDKKRFARRKTRKNQ